jgi:hypothetical protein
MKTKQNIKFLFLIIPAVFFFSELFGQNANTAQKVRFTIHDAAVIKFTPPDNILDYIQASNKTVSQSIKNKPVSQTLSSSVSSVKQDQWLKNMQVQSPRKFYLAVYPVRYSRKCTTALPNKTINMIDLVYTASQE